MGTCTWFTFWQRHTVHVQKLVGDAYTVHVCTAYLHVHSRLPLCTCTLYMYIVHVSEEDSR